jgi:predicted transcriptional regulator
MKHKIETLVDDGLYQEVKSLAAQKRREMTEVVQLALRDFVQNQKRKRALKSGLVRFLEAPELKLTPEQIRESLELDFFDQ